MSDTSARRTFFRDSGWMALAATLGGVFNMASNFIAQRMPQGQFNVFDTALSALGILAIPALGMQASFAAQAAGADSEERQRQLAATMRGALGFLAVVWAGLAAWCFVGEKHIMAAYNLSQPAILWVVLLIVLVTLLTPIPNGTLQGRQDFFWFGWATLLNGAGRFGVLLVVVHIFKQGALGGLLGVLWGAVLVFGLVTWRTWNSLSAPSARFDWLSWGRRLVPVTIGLGSLSFIMQADALIVREKLQPLLTPDEVDGYSAVRKIAQALVFVVGALTSVMYPKVARSFQNSQPTDVLKLTLVLTSVIAVGGATVATLFPELPLRLLSPERLLTSKSLVPPFCWALVPLALSNVLVWNLLARECYRSVPWMAVLAGGCWWALQKFSNRPLDVIGIAALFNSLLLLVCVVFVWLEGRKDRRRA
jgi:O-antigen/teichoic acid export membrane protein